MSKVLSVSVAAYNVQHFIRQNLDSFVESGVLEDVEILVTDDGSRDETPAIVAEYEAKFPGSIRLIRQENQGPGSTVRSGVRHAGGKYFRMVDGDDWVDPRAFAELVALLKETEADMVLCAYTKVDEKTGEKAPVPLNLPAGVECQTEVPFASVARELLLTMHQTVYKTSLMKRIGEQILNGFYTDMQYLLLPIPDVQTVLYFPGFVYQYRVALDGQSMSYPSMQKNIAQHEAMLNSIIALAEGYGQKENKNAETEAFLLRHAAFLCGTQMGILLSFRPDRAAKEAFYRFYENLKTQHPAVFRLFSELKTAKVLRLPLFYTTVSRLHRRKIGMKDKA